MAVKTLIAKDIMMGIAGTFVGCAQSGSLNLSKEELDAVCAASGDWAEYAEGRKSWTMEISALLREADGADAATNHTFHDAFDVFDTGGIVDVEYVIGTYTYSGKAFSTALSQSYANSDAQTWSTTLRGTGPLVKALTPVGA